MGQHLVHACGHNSSLPVCRPAYAQSSNPTAFQSLKRGELAESSAHKGQNLPRQPLKPPVVAAAAAGVCLLYAAAPAAGTVVVSPLLWAFECWCAASTAGVAAAAGTTFLLQGSASEGGGSSAWLWTSATVTSCASLLLAKGAPVVPAVT